MDRSQVEIMGINESWLRTGEEGRAPSVPGYRLQHIPRPNTVRSGRGGGVAFYIKKGLQTRACAFPKHETVEQMWIGLNVNSLKIAIGTAYRPPWLNIDVFLDVLTDSVQALAKYDHIVLLGDFNVNLLNKNDSKTIKLQTFFNYLQLTQIVNSPTHFTESSETLIDTISTNLPALSVKVTPIAALSRHAFLECVLNVKKGKVPSKSIMYRPLKRICLDSFNDDLCAIPWEDLSASGCVNHMVLSFNKFVIELFDKHAPIRNKVVKERLFPWITCNIKLMMKLRDDAHAHWRNDKSEPNKAIYKQYKHLVIEAINNEKRAYFKYNVNNKIKYPKLLWENLKHTVLPKKSAELPSQFTDAEAINSHFLNVPGSNDVTISQLTYFEFNKLHDNVFSFRTTTDFEILKTIKRLHSNAEGTDKISLDMLLMTLPQSSVAIKAIMDASLMSSVFPSEWKVALVHPLPKISDPLTPKDLRPISILPCLSKILEKIVYSQMSAYLESNLILPEYQSGFRTGRGTVTALLDVTDNVLVAQDSGLCTLLVLLDFSRAFDSINIALLLSKLSYYGFSIDAVKWFDSYLSYRTQFVEIIHENGRKHTSAAALVPRGVPQGSVLGPLLFILYCADIIHQIKYCKYHLYADDLQLYYAFKPEEYHSVVKLVNDDLHRVAEWSDRNSLVLNPNKSKFILFGTINQLSKVDHHDGEIHIRGNALERVYQARNLGLLMDFDLRFEEHVSQNVRNCFYRLKILYKVRKYLSQELRIQLVEALVLSKLNYADVVYGPRLLCRTKRLIQRVQNACARFSFDIPPRNYISPFLNNHRLLRMRSRRKLHLAGLLFGVIKLGKPLYLTSKLNWAGDGDTERLRRCRSQLRVPLHRTAAFRGSFTYSATRCWNNIPPPIRNLKSKFSFKMQLKKFLLEKQVEFQDHVAEFSFL